MTKYKEYLSSKGVTLENDCPMLPMLIANTGVYLDGVITAVTDKGLLVRMITTAGIEEVLYGRDGKIIA